MAISTVSPPGLGPTASISWRANVKRHPAQGNERDRMGSVLRSCRRTEPLSRCDPATTFYGFKGTPSARQAVRPGQVVRYARQHRDPHWTMDHAVGGWDWRGVSPQ